MNKFAALVKYTVVENVRQKFFYALGVFGAVVLAGSGILSAIGGEQKIRVLRDLGYFAAEYVALFAAVLVGTNFIYDEIENKSIYMIVARPVSRWTYLAGRYCGFLLSVTVLIVFMAVLNAGAIKLSLGRLAADDALIPVLIIMKMAVVLSLAMFLAMLTTSKSASMIFTLFLWGLGHFAAELDFLSRLAASPAVKALSFVTGVIVPRLDKFSPLDVRSLSAGYFAGVLFYTIFYSLAALAAARAIFGKKEF